MIDRVTLPSNPVPVGEPAPDFELRQSFESSWSLGRLTAGGPALLAFYVFDFGHF